MSLLASRSTFIGASTRRWASVGAVTAVDGQTRVADGRN